ncbi:hypothetical protein MBELCI_1933 [Limimaricola cinnabarinus LL-001]|uniref:Uncharacterized protein n=1 Tax=Limimaricola cinnabarinus LL-001 TaxID=1337093 RepID=U2YLE2_9RHOB|nr:hypothetical protein MBELCI_1933 [Limimaricola cinnabarinus LL-001]
MIPDPALADITPRAADPDGRHTLVLVTGLRAPGARPQ